MAKPRDFSITFAGAGTREFQARGRFLRVLATPTAAVFISLDGGQELERGAGQEIADADPAGFTRISVRSTVAQTIRFVVSEVSQADSRTEVAVTATATVLGGSVLDAPSMVEVTAGDTVEIVAGNPDRVELRVALGSSEPGPVWLGPAGVGDEEGGLLEPGVVDYIATTAAVFAHNPHATDSVFVSVLELESP